MKSRNQYLIVALAGLAGGFAFPPMRLGFLAFLCFVPLIAVLEQRMDVGMVKKNQNALLYTFFFCFHGAANWWVMSWQKETDPYLMAAGAGLWLGHPFFLMPAFWVYQYARRRSSSITLSLVMLGLAWTGIEWLHSLSDLSYPWLALGYTQVYNTVLIQIADIGGVWMVSAFVMSINLVIAHYYLTRERIIRHLVTASLIIFAVSGYGSYMSLLFRHYSSDVKGRSLTVGLVQPSIDPWVKWQGGINDMISMHQNLQDSLNRIQHCDLNVWSETAIPYGLTLPENISLLNRLQSWVDSSQTALLTGFADYEFFEAHNAPSTAQRFPLDPQKLVRVYNSAGIITPGYRDLPRHHKSRLTPFGEYMPFSDDFPIIQSWLKWGVGISGWNKGAGASVVPLRRGSDTLAMIGPVICIESIYPSHVADYVRRGATLLAVITNDAWYDGTFGPEQHYCISRMRAVETRTNIIRCGNSGVSGLIDHAGRSVVQAEARKRCAQLCTLPVLGVQDEYTYLSPYIRFGDWLPQLCTVLFASLCLWLGIKARKQSASSTAA